MEPYSIRFCSFPYNLFLRPRIKTVYTRCGIWEKIKKPGLVKEMLGKLGDLTRELLYLQ